MPKLSFWCRILQTQAKTMLTKTVALLALLQLIAVSGIAEDTEPIREGENVSIRLKGRTALEFHRLRNGMIHNKPRDSAELRGRVLRILETKPSGLLVYLIEVKIGVLGSNESPFDYDASSMVTVTAFVMEKDFKLESPQHAGVPRYEIELPDDLAKVKIRL